MKYRKGMRHQLRESRVHTSQTHTLRRFIEELLRKSAFWKSRMACAYRSASYRSAVKYLTVS